MALDFSEPVNRVRKLIPDLVLLGDPAQPGVTPSYIFTDAELQSFLDDENPAQLTTVPGYIIKRAAAYAMIALANSENLIAKKITTQDQVTDGPAVAKQLTASASVLLAQAARDEETAIGAAQNTESLIAVFPSAPVVEPLLFVPSYWR